MITHETDPDPHDAIQTPTTTPPLSLQDKLAALHGFSRDDLRANRSGTITAMQGMHLIGTLGSVARRAAVISFVVVVAAIAIFGALVQADAREKHGGLLDAIAPGETGTAIAILIAASLALFIAVAIVLTLVLGRETWRDIIGGDATTITGTLRRETTPPADHGERPHYHYVINDVRCDVSRAAYNVLPDGDVGTYRLHYTPHAHIVLSIEPAQPQTVD